MGDDEILQLFYHRVEYAISAVEEKYGRLCRSVARGILKDERDVEECVNDTCMRAWNAIPPEKPRSLEAYLVRITRNLALDRYAYHHSQKRETALTEAYEELEADGFLFTVAGKGCFVAEKNLDLIREQKLKELEDHLDAAVELAAQCGISSAQLQEMLRILLREEGTHERD